MKYLFTLFFGFMCTGLIMAQTPLEFNIENKMNGTYIGNVPLELGTTFYIQKFELKAKREQTPGSGGFFSPEEGTNWLINESSFNFASAFHLEAEVESKDTEQFSALYSLLSSFPSKSFQFPIIGDPTLPLAL